jgi:pSer/pThr/pTyr-binding forkhead associated (FHA) protein
MGLEKSAESSTHPSILLVIQAEGGEERHPLREGETTIGRDPSNHIRITDYLVSSFHAKIIHSGGEISLVDLASANKTRVNGHPIVQKAVKYGDEIHFAGVSCRLVDPLGAAHQEQESDTPVPRLPSNSQPESESIDSASVSSSTKWNPPVSKLYLSGGVLVLFALVAALATQVC